MAATSRTNGRDLRARMLGDVPVTDRVLDVDGIATSVLEGGDGPPLVLLHGGIECGGAMWAPVLPMLAERHRLVVPDLPGLGESAPAPRLDVDAFARWFACLLEQTNIERPTLVAHSLVGSLGARLAARHSALIGRLVIYAAPGVGPYRMPLRLRYVAIRFALRPTAGNAARFQRFALLDRDATRRRDPDWFDALDAYTRARAGESHVKKTMRHLVAAGTTPIPGAELRRIDVPTALIWGRHDRMVPLDVAERASTRYGWPLHVIDHAAHVPHIEQPEAFVASLASPTAPNGEH
jgi:2-hydroxymuconate-semialdehyde hydrolase